MHTKTLKLRVRDKHCSVLNQQARQVNFVWNYINDLSARSIRERGVFLSAYDIQKYTNGASKELGLHSKTVFAVARSSSLAASQDGSYICIRIRHLPFFFFMLPVTCPEPAGFAPG